MAVKTAYDAIVVGSGASGGLAAYELGRRGMKVLLLEAGRAIDPARDFIHHKWPYDFKYRGRISPSKVDIEPYTADSWTEHLYADVRELPYTTPPDKPFVWVRVRALGGRSLVWGRVSLRLSDLDFKAASHDGYGEDWPISYKDVAPYYDYVETLIGVSGSIENIPHLPDGKYLPPVPLVCGELDLKRGCEKLGIRLIPNRCAVITRDYDGRLACHWCGYCSRGCDSTSMFNSVVVTIPKALRTGNVTLRTNAVVRQVLVDEKTGKAKGVEYVDRISRQSYEEQAKVVVLAASTLESTRIMLNSKSRLYPSGIANSSGLLGHYFCEHIMGARILGVAPRRKGAQIENEDGRPTGVYIVRFRNVKERHPKFIRGYGYQGSAGSKLFPSHAQHLVGFGEDLKKEIKRLHPAVVGMTGFGEVLPRYENYVELDPNVVDPWGVPALRINVTFGDNEREMGEDMADMAEEIFRAAGFEILHMDRELSTPGWSIHELGTARMGTDPKRSVLNPFCQAHDVKNLFVVDGSCFVSAGNQNPTLTILALCARACDYLAEEFKRGDL